MAKSIDASMEIPIRPLVPADRAAFRALRQQALATDPASFLMTAAEERAVDRLNLENLLERPGAANCLFGAEAGQDLVGIAAIATRNFVKLRHIAYLASVYVAPEARGRGVGRRLVEAAIKHAFAAPGIDVIQLDVVAGMKAEALYRTLGFVEFGFEPDAHRHEGRSHDLRHMLLRRPAAARAPRPRQ